MNKLSFHEKLNYSQNLWSIRIHSNQSLKHTLSEVFFIDRMDCSYLSYSSYFGTRRARLGYIFWGCEKGCRENWKSSRSKKSNQQSQK